MSSIRRAPDSFRFPDGRRVGIVFNIAYEGWSEGQVPGIGPMGNPLKPGFFDANAVLIDVQEMQRDAATIICLRSVLMKPEHRAWADRIWTILSDATSAAGLER